jgi:anti-sigma factor RsiW
VTAGCQTCRDLIGGYVLDALEPFERDLVRRHVETCEACAREHAELAAIPALLDVADSADAVPLRPPARLEEAVLDRFARERRGVTPSAERAGAGEPAGAAPSRRRWLAPVAVALACAVAAVAVAIAVSGDEPAGGDGRAARSTAATAGSTPATAEQQARAPDSGGSAPVYRVSLAGAGPLPRAAGEARLYPGDTGTGVHLRVSGLVPSSYEYELWCVRDDGWKLSAGTFRADAAGNVDVRLTTAADPTQYDALAIQARPAGRSADARGQRVLMGRIRS